MKTLIIDNHSKNLKDLLLLFPESEIIKKEEIRDDVDQSKYSLIVISGGSGVSPVIDYPTEYSHQLSLVRKSTVPVLGICLGAEIINYAFGGSLKRLNGLHHGQIELSIKNESLAEMLHSHTVFVREAHRIGVDVLPNGFEACAFSDHGVEIFKHYERPIIGLQFHPETTHNKELFYWVLKNLGLRK